MDTKSFLDDNFDEIVIEESEVLSPNSPKPLEESVNATTEDETQYETKPKTLVQFLAVLVISYGCFINGTIVVLPAVLIPSLLAENGTNMSVDVRGKFSSFSFIVSEEDVALIVSVCSLGMLAGSLLVGPTSNRIGRKGGSFLGSFLFLVVGYLLVGLSFNVWMILIGRFLMGAALGFSTNISTIYIVETASPKLRGRLAVLPAIAGSLGLLICQCLGALLEWRYLCFTLASFTLPFMVLLIFIPETPVYLMSKERTEAAKRVLKSLRGNNWNVAAEINALAINISTSGDNKRLSGFSVILRPFGLSLILMFFFQFSGINIILQYTVNIFILAGSSVDEFEATIYVGLALLASNAFTLAIVGRFPRRFMILSSSLGITTCLGIMGLYFALPYHYAQNVRWLPLVLLMMYIFFFNLGFGSIIWVTVAEILPLHHRALTNGLCVSFTCICSFFTSYSYPSLMSYLGGQGVFWLYSGVSFVGFLFSLFFLPETKDKGTSTN